MKKSVPALGACMFIGKDINGRRLLVPTQYASALDKECARINFYNKFDWLKEKAARLKHLFARNCKNKVKNYMSAVEERLAPLRFVKK